MASASQSVHGRAPRKKKQERKRQMFSALQGDLLEVSVRSMEGGDLAVIADSDAVALELADEIVGHRLVKVFPTVEKRH
jgi:hypothetical protein